MTEAATNAAIGGAIGGTSTNPNAVPMLETPFADPGVEALRLRLNELIAGLRRQV